MNKNIGEKLEFRTKSNFEQKWFKSYTAFNLAWNASKEGWLHAVKPPLQRGEGLEWIKSIFTVWGDF